MRNIKYLVVLFCVIASSIFCVLSMFDTGRSCDLRSKEVVFLYARFPEPCQSSEKGKKNRYELSLRSMREMLNDLKREDFIQHVFSAITSTPSNCEHLIATKELLDTIRKVEFLVDDQPDAANRVRGKVIARSSSQMLSRAIANEYADLLRQLVEDESRLRIDKSTMSYYSDYHIKKKELKSLEDRLLQKGTGDDDCQSLRQDIIRVKGEMRKIDAEWKKRIETLHKEVGGTVDFSEN